MRRRGHYRETTQDWTLPPDPTQEEVNERAVELYGPNPDHSMDASVVAELEAEGATPTQATSARDQFWLSFDINKRHRPS